MQVALTPQLTDGRPFPNAKRKARLEALAERNDALTLLRRAIESAPDDDDGRGELAIAEVERRRRRYEQFRHHKDTLLNHLPPELRRTAEQIEGDGVREALAALVARLEAGRVALVEGRSRAALARLPPDERADAAERLAQLAASHDKHVRCLAFLSSHECDPEERRARAWPDRRARLEQVLAAVAEYADAAEDDADAVSPDEHGDVYRAVGVPARLYEEEDGADEGEGGAGGEGEGEAEAEADADGGDADGDDAGDAAPPPPPPPPAPAPQPNTALEWAALAGAGAGAAPPPWAAATAPAPLVVPPSPAAAAAPPSPRAREALLRAASPLRFAPAPAPAPATGRSASVSVGGRAAAPAGAGAAGASAGWLTSSGSRSASAARHPGVGGAHAVLAEGSGGSGGGGGGADAQSDYVESPRAAAAGGGAGGGAAPRAGEPALPALRALVAAFPAVALNADGERRLARFAAAAPAPLRARVAFPAHEQRFPWELTKFDYARRVVDTAALALAELVDRAHLEEWLRADPDARAGDEVDAYALLKYLRYHASERAAGAAAFLERLRGAPDAPPLAPADADAVRGALAALLELRNAVVHRPLFRASQLALATVLEEAAAAGELFRVLAQGAPAGATARLAHQALLDLRKRAAVHAAAKGARLAAPAAPGAAAPPPPGAGAPAAAAAQRAARDAADALAVALARAAALEAAAAERGALAARLVSADAAVAAQARLLAARADEADALRAQLDALRAAAWR